MKKIKCILKISSVYVGLIIGAGFASGRELITFFISYGKIWPLGLILTGILLSIVGYMIFMIIEKENIRTYDAFLSVILGKCSSKFIGIISGVFLYVLFCAMISASGSLFYEAFGLSRVWGSFGLALFSFIVFGGGVEKFIKVNTVFAPVMVAGTVIICLITHLSQIKAVFLASGSAAEYPYLVLFSSVVYVSYNIISSVPVFVETNGIIKKCPYAKIGAVTGGLIMSLIGIFMGIVLRQEGNSIYNMDMPMLMAVSTNRLFIEYIYIIIIFMAIVTTAVGNGYSTVRWIEERINIKGFYIKIFVCLSSVVLSFMEFSQFTDKVYPVFGFLGLLELFCIFKYFLRSKIQFPKSDKYSIIKVKLNSVRRCFFVRKKEYY